MSHNEVVEYLMKKQYIMPQVIDSEVPPELYLQFQGDKSKIRQQYLNSIDSTRLTFALSKYNRATLIGKPVSVYAKTIRGNSYLVLRFPSTDVHIPMSQIDENVLENIRDDFIQVTVVRQGKLIEALDYKLLFSTYSLSKAQEIVEDAEKNGIPLLHIIVAGYGYVPVPNIVKLYTWRILPVLSPVAGKPIHVVEFSKPNTGKTTYAIRNKFMLAWDYLNESPSYAKLIMDAKTNSLGLVFTSKGVVIDEVDKYGKELRDVLEIMLTGLEQGIWTRGKGSRSTPPIVRKIPFVFYGNVPSGTTTTLTSTRDMFVNQFVKQYRLSEDSVNALQDRFAVIQYVTENVNASDYVSGYVMPNALLRGILKVVNEKANKEYKQIDEFDGRRRIQYSQVMSVYNVLQPIIIQDEIINTEEYAKALVSGKVK